MIQGERTLRHLIAPFDPFLAARGVTEIIVNKPGEIGVEQHGRWSWHAAPEMTIKRLDAIGILTGSMISKEFDPDNPICLGTLPDGQRFTAVRTPMTSPETIAINIRVPSQEERTVRDDDFEALMASANARTTSAADENLTALYRQKRWAEFFTGAVHARKTILATGRVGSGKTTLLKRLLPDIPSDERLVTIEDTAEFGILRQLNRVSLFYGSANVSAEDAVKVALRMRPDRILMQELRGAEAFAFLRASLTGHPGGMTTLHADRGADAAFEALAVMVKTDPAGREIPDDKLRLLIRRLIDVVAWCDRGPDGFTVPYVYFAAAENQ